MISRSLDQILLALLEELESPTPALGGRCSIHLSYSSINIVSILYNFLQYKTIKNILNYLKQKFIIYKFTKNCIINL